MLSKRWEIAPQDPRVEEKLAAALQIRSLAARLLVNRGITSIEAAREFLAPSLQRLYDPFLMRGMAEALFQIFPDQLVFLEQRRHVLGGEPPGLRLPDDTEP
jgi:hypothetical protein